MSGSATTTPTRSAIIVIAGFRQSDRHSSGVGKLLGRLIDEFPDRSLDYPVALRAWDSDHKATAEVIRQRKPDQIYVVGYSYGCGWGLVRLGQALKPSWNQFWINHAYCIDPVPRFRFLPAKAISLTRSGVFSLPKYVDTCWYWRQLNGSPFGRRVVDPLDLYPLTKQHNHGCVSCRAVFGSPMNLDRHAHESERNRIVTHDSHTTIDDREDIREEIIADLKKRILR